MNNLIVNNRSAPVERNSNVIRIKDGVIEDIFMHNRVGYVTVSYGIMGDFNMTHITFVTLIVNAGTRIQNEFGRNMVFSNLRVGMRINAIISSRMTMSYPPQSIAYEITVLNQTEPFHVTTGRVIEVDTRNNFLYTGNRRDMTPEMRFVVTNETCILDQRGRNIRLQDINPGDTVRVEHATFQTASIPPQTTAFCIRLL